MYKIAAFLLIALASPLALAADRPGSPDVGAQQAQALCTACHAIGPGGGGSDMAPPLPAVAAMRSDEAIEIFLAAPHGSMPPVTLTRQQIADLVAYMASLRPVPAPAR